jgi:thiol:disulfide interchange protein
VQKFPGDWPKEISGVIVTESGNLRTGFEVKLPVSDNPPAGETTSRPGVAPVSNSPDQNMETGATPVLRPQSLWQMLLYAFIGGLILNIMPCVLPVIALKILGFVSEANTNRAASARWDWFTRSGCWCRFSRSRWSSSASRPPDTTPAGACSSAIRNSSSCLTTLVTLVALNLFGVFEVTLGGRATLSAAGQLASKHGAAGAFFNGLLATALATPCTAPFLAPALGFAFAKAQP